MLLATYLTGNEGQKFRTVFSENAPLRENKRKSRYANKYSLTQHYCSDLYHAVSTTESSKGVLNGERRVTRYLKHR